MFLPLFIKDLTNTRLLWTNISPGFNTLHHLRGVHTTKTKLMVKMSTSSVFHPTLVHRTGHLSCVHNHMLHISPCQAGAVRQYMRLNWRFNSPCVGWWSTAVITETFISTLKEREIYKPSKFFWLKFPWSKFLWSKLLDQSFQDQSFRDQRIRNESFCDRSFCDQSFRDQSFCDQSFQDQSFCDQSFCDQSFRDQSFRDQSFRNQSFYDQSLYDQSFSGQRSAITTFHKSGNNLTLLPR